MTVGVCLLAVRAFGQDTPNAAETLDGCKLVTQNLASRIGVAGSAQKSNYGSDGICNVETADARFIVSMPSRLVLGFVRKDSNGTRPGATALSLKTPDAAAEAGAAWLRKAGWSVGGLRTSRSDGLSRYLVEFEGQSPSPNSVTTLALDAATGEVRAAWRANHLGSPEIDALSAPMLSPQWLAVALPFATRLNRSTEVRQATINPSGTMYVLTTGDALVGLATKSGEIALWASTKKEDDLQSGAQILDEGPAIWAAGEKWLRLAGLELLPHVELKPTWNNGLLRYHLKFSDQPKGVGNQITFEINPRSGEVISMLRAVGYTASPPPQEPVGEVVAIEAVRNAVRRAWGVEASGLEVGGLTQVLSGTVVDGPLADPARPRTVEAKITRQAYQIEGSVRTDLGQAVRFIAFVDTETGLVLKGDLGKDAVLSRSKRQSSIDSAPGATWQYAALGVTIALVVPIASWGRIRYRNRKQRS